MAERSVRDPSAPPLRARFAADPANPIDSFEPAPATRRWTAPEPEPRRARGSDLRRAQARDSQHARDTGQARPVEVGRTTPASLPSDRRRLVAAIASAVVPGLGQAVNGRLRPALVLGVPALIILVAGLLFAQSDRPSMLVARLVAPPILGFLLLLNVAILTWRGVAVVHAFADRRYPGRPGRLGAVGLAALLVATVAPHLAAWSYGTAAQTMFGQIFAGSSVRSVSAGPGTTERLNVLLIGVDAAPGRTEALTDSLIVVSLDPVGRTVSMVSIPRDLASVPLGDGNVFGPKINSLMSWAGSHPKEFPKGGVGTLEGAIGALLGIPIHAYASVDLTGFAAMVDAVGGVDINVRKALADPIYPRLDGTRGWSVQPGLHHFNGTDALAYARIRKAAGESDFTRAARQQEVLVALRNQAVSAGILFNLPRLLDAIGSTVRTDLSQDRLPELAALAEQIGGASTMKLVLGGPMIKSGGSTQYGSTFVPVPARIREMVKIVFGPPGGDPTWPPVPKASPEPPGGDRGGSAASGAPPTE